MDGSGAGGGEPLPTCLGAASLADGACQMRCGFRVSPGTDQYGLPFVTCCQGCARGLPHDARCMQLPLGASDEEVALAYQLAYQLAEVPHSPQPRAAHPGGELLDADMELANAMQLAELQYAAEEQAGGQRQSPRPHRAEPLLASDPLWGEVSIRPGELASCCKCLVFNCCPCAMIGCGKQARGIWRRFILSWSMAVAVLQMAMFAAALVLDGGHVPFAENPTLGPHYHTLDFLGAKNAARILRYGEWWRLCTPILLHAGWLHLIGNLVVQLRTCVVLEDTWGHTRWLLIYVLSGLYSTLASCIVSPNHLSVGSSGALCGIIGAWLVFLLITWNQTLPRHTGERNLTVASAGFAVATIVATSFLPLMDFAAHVGGLLMGATVSMVTFADMLQHQVWRISTTLCGIVLTLLLAGGALGWFLNSTQPSDVLLDLCRPKDC